jgi:Leucine Rich repeat
LVRIATLEHLTFLDISFAHHVTDHGLRAFKDKHFPISKLFINGLTGISSQGVADLVGTCIETLRIFEASLLTQESMQSHFCTVLSHAFHLEELDLTGDSNIGDEGIAALSKGDIKLENNQT